jgi:hypothetical protein
LRLLGWLSPAAYPGATQDMVKAHGIALMSPPLF